MIFNGIRILDFTQVISGSYATAILGDLGAEILKIEPPGSGDTLRFAGPMVSGESAFFMMLNRNKKSLSIDLKKPEGVAIIRDLIPKCDIFIQNFTPGVMDRFGLGYEDVCRIKSDIIYACVSGYGYNNRYSQRPAYDNIIQSETGLAAQNGPADNGIPLRSPLSISDYTAGMYGAMALASALFHHEKTGEGQFIDVAMYDSLVSLMDNSFLTYDLSGDAVRAKRNNPVDKEEELRRLGLRSSGNRHPGAAPHGFYKTRDGYIAHMSLTNKMWHKLLTIIGREDLINDPKFEKLDSRKAHWREIDTLVETWSRQLTTAEALNVLKQNELPCGQVRTIDEVFDDPHSRERGLFEEIENAHGGRARVTRLPIKFSKTPATIRRSSPLLGEHSEEVLTGLLGYPIEKTKTLLQDKIIFKTSE